MSTEIRIIYKNLVGLVREYEKLSAERSFLLNGVQARLAEVNSDRQTVVAEAQTQLERLNVLRVAAGEPALTLQELREAIKSGPRRFL